jgi:hypothetical protein
MCMVEQRSCGVTVWHGSSQLLELDSIWLTSLKGKISSSN